MAVGGGCGMRNSAQYEERPTWRAPRDRVLVSPLKPSRKILDQDNVVFFTLLNEAFRRFAMKLSSSPVYRKIVMCS